MLQFTIRRYAREASLLDRRLDHYEARSEDMDVKMACWSKIFSHITAFAFISAGSALVTKAGEAFPSGSMLAVVLNFGVFFWLFRLTDYMRNRVEKKGTAKHMVEVWEEASEEAENDVAGLALSYMLVQALIHVCLGLVLHHGEVVEPGAHGHGHHAEGVHAEGEHAVERLLHEVTHAHHSHHGHGHGRHRVTLAAHPHGIAPFEHVLYLVGFAAIFAGAAVLAVWLTARLKMGEYENRPGMETILNYAKRWWFIGQSVCAMSMAWSLQYVGKWEIARSLYHSGCTLDAESTCQRVFVALSTSFVAFLFIFVLDKIEDMESTGAVADKCMRSIIIALSILIGFAWEHSFDGGVEVLAELTAEKNEMYPVWVKLFMAAGVFATVVPAWRLYILKTVKSLPKTSLCSCGAFLKHDAKFCPACGARRDEDILLESHFRGRGHQHGASELDSIQGAFQAISPSQGAAKASYTNIPGSNGKIVPQGIDQSPISLGGRQPPRTPRSARGTR
jgi:hypothetical protein